MVSVMCCNCLRLMGKAPGLVEIGLEPSGSVNIEELLKKLKIMRPSCAEFGSKEEADAEAKRRGWQTIDLKGKSNHRCPACRPVAGTVHDSERAGAFIDWDADPCSYLDNV